jgi:hypothetical protein
MNDAVLQEIRKSHCAKKDEVKHNCAGSCKITPKGIELSCPICGDDKPNMLNYDKKVIARATRICQVIGITFENMDFMVQKRIVEEIFRDYCPNCNAVHILTKDYFSCSCGFNYSEYKGWYNSDKV